MGVRAAAVSLCCACLLALPLAVPAQTAPAEPPAPSAAPVAEPAAPPAPSSPAAAPVEEPKAEAPAPAAAPAEERKAEAPQPATAPAEERKPEPPQPATAPAEERQTEAPQPPEAPPPPRASSQPLDPRADTGPIVRPPVAEGDQWIYRHANGKSSVVIRQRIEKVSEDRVALLTEQIGSPDTTTALYDREWGLVASGYNEYRPALRYYAFPLYAGKRWGIDSEVSNFGAGQASRVKGEAHAAGWENVDVAAGKYLALRIEIDVETADPGDAARRIRVRETHWYARTVMRPVKVESHSIVADQAPTNDTVELVRYRMQ
jgi:hypothetical protein